MQSKIEKRIVNKNCVCYLFSRRFAVLRAKKPDLPCFKRFLKICKKNHVPVIFLLHKSELEAEPDICIGSGESICHERIVHGMVGKD